MGAVTPRVVLDTNVLVAGLRSRRGASFALLERFGAGAFRPVVSVPLVLEYEGILKAQSRSLGLTHQDLDDILDFLCSVADLHQVYFLWRPILRDPSDDMLLEVAVGSGCHGIVTHNTKDFGAASAFNLRILRPRDFLGRAR